MPFRIGEYVRVYDDDGGEWYGVIVAPVRDGVFRIRVGGTGGDSTITNDVAEAAMDPIRAPHRVPRIPGVVPPRAPDVPVVAGPPHRFNAGLLRDADESLLFPVFCRCLQPPDPTPSAAAQPALIVGASALRSGASAVGTSSGSSSLLERRKRLGLTAGHGKQAPAPVRFRPVIAGGHFENAANCAMVTAAAVITYGTGSRLCMNSLDIARGVAQQINLRARVIAASAPRPPSSSSSAGGGVNIAPASSDNQSGLRFADLCAFTAYPAQVYTGSMEIGNVQEFIEGRGLRAHINGLRDYCASVLRIYGLTRVDTFGSADHKRRLPDIKVEMLRISAINPGAVFAVYARSHWNFARVEGGRPYFFDFQRDHILRVGGMLNFTLAYVSNLDPETDGGTTTRIASLGPEVDSGGGGASSSSGYDFDAASRREREALHREARGRAMTSSDDSAMEGVLLAFY